MSAVHPYTATDPQRIGPYRILARLGLGGCGVVYRAEHFETREPAAVKTVAAEGGDASALRREIRTLSALRHPGVASIVTEGVSGGVPWYAMELVHGETLQRRLRRATTFDDRSALLSTVAGLCEPLAFLHGHGVVHRDLKPSNVVVTTQGRPVIVDLGLTARFAGAEGRDALEAAGLAIGSSAYMPPEQARGELLDARADLYALGCILYEVLTGRPPFKGNASELAYRHIHEVPLLPSHLVPEVPPELDALVARLLRKRPAERIGYARDVRTALRRAGVQSPAGDASDDSTPGYVYRPRFVGRGAPMRELHSCLVRAVRGRGSLVLVSGESGAGKTRLATELATAARSFRMRVVTGECQRLGAGPEARPPRPPLAPLRPLWQAFADHLRALEPEQAHALRDRTRGGVSLLAAYEPALAGLAADTEAPCTSPQAARRRLLEGLTETLSAFAWERPLVLVLDDLQWADELSLAWLEALAERLPATGALVVGTFRSDETGDALRSLAGAAWTRHIALDRLDDEAVASMIGDMLAVGDPPRRLVEPIVRRAEGNPFFVAEYVRAAVAEGVVRRDEDGRWRTTRQQGPSIDAVELPESVRALLERRMSGLSAPARRMLEAGAVLGRELDAPAWARSAGLDTASAARATAELAARHIVEATGPQRYRFTHDRLRETAYDRISSDRRRGLHRTVARVLEASRAGASSAAALAHHWSMAGEPLEASRHRLEAGEHALQHGAYREAAGWLRAAQPALSGDTELQHRLRCERLLADAHWGLGELTQSRTCCERVLRTAGERASRGGLATTAGRLVLERALRREPDARARDATAETALAAARLAYISYFANDMTAVATHTLQAVALAERARDDTGMARPYAQLGYVAGVARLRSVAETCFARARDAAERAGDIESLSFARLSEGAHHLGFARWQQAEGAALQSLELARQSHEPRAVGTCLALLGHVEYYAGNARSSAHRFGQLAEEAGASGDQQQQAWGRLGKGRAWLVLGRVDEAHALLEQAEALLADTDDVASSIVCHGLRADAERARGDLENAVRHADVALGLLRRRAPTVFPCVHGYLGAADAYLAAWSRRTPPGASPDAAERAVRALGRFATIFPFARPAARAREAALQRTRATR